MVQFRCWALEGWLPEHTLLCLQSYPTLKILDENPFLNHWCDMSLFTLEHQQRVTLLNAQKRENNESVQFAKQMLENNAANAMLDCTLNALENGTKSRRYLS